MLAKQTFGTVRTEFDAHVRDRIIFIGLSINTIDVIIFMEFLMSPKKIKYLTTILFFNTLMSFSLVCFSLPAMSEFFIDDPCNKNNNNNYQVYSTDRHEF